MRAAAGLDAHDALLRQRLQPRQHHGVLLGVDVVGDDGDRELVAHRLAEFFRKRCLTRADRAADTDTKRSVVHLQSSSCPSITRGTAVNIGFRGASPSYPKGPYMRPRSSSVEAAAQAATSTTIGSSPARERHRIALAENAEADAGLDKIGGEGLQERAERIGKRNSMRSRESRRRRRNRRNPAAEFSARGRPAFGRLQKGRALRASIPCAARAIRQALRQVMAISARSPPRGARRQLRQTAPHRSSPDPLRRSCSIHLAQISRVGDQHRHGRRAPAHGCS